MHEGGHTGVPLTAPDWVSRMKAFCFLYSTTLVTRRNVRTNRRMRSRATC